MSDMASRGGLRRFDGATMDGAAVDAVLINGRVAYSKDDGLAPELGKETGFGRFLPARGGAAPMAAPARGLPA